MADGVIAAAAVVPLCHFSHEHGHQIVTSVRVFAPFLHQRFVYEMRVFHALDHFENRFPVLRHRPETTPRRVYSAQNAFTAVLTSKTGARSAAWRRRIFSIRPRPNAASTSSSGRPPATLCPALCDSRSRRCTPGKDSWCRLDVGRTLEFSAETTHAAASTDKSFLATATRVHVTDMVEDTASMMLRCKSFFFSPNLDTPTVLSQLHTNFRCSFQRAPRVNIRPKSRIGFDQNGTRGHGSDCRDRDDVGRCTRANCGPWQRREQRRVRRVQAARPARTVPGRYDGHRPGDQYPCSTRIPRFVQNDDSNKRARVPCNTVTSCKRVWLGRDPETSRYNPSDRTPGT